MKYFYISMLVVVLALWLKPSSKQLDPMERCENLFKIQHFGDLNLKLVRSKDGIFSRFIVYHFKLPDGDILQVKEIMTKSGYTNWTHGEIWVEDSHFGDSEGSLFAYLDRGNIHYTVGLDVTKKEVFLASY